MPGFRTPCTSDVSAVDERVSLSLPPPVESEPPRLKSEAGAAEGADVVAATDVEDENDDVPVLIGAPMKVLPDDIPEFMTAAVPLGPKLPMLMEPE